MVTVKLPCSERFDTQMEMHTTTHTNNISLAQLFQNNFSNESHRHGIIDDGKHKKIFIFRNREYHVQKTEDFELKCILLQTSFLCCNFVFHTTNHTLHAD